jgi:hypothetical protein
MANDIGASSLTAPDADMRGMPLQISVAAWHLKRVPIWYEGMVILSFGVTVLCAIASLAGVPERMTFPITGVALIGCGHPVSIGYFVANLIVGQPNHMASQTDAAWYIVFCSALAPYIMTLLAVAGWRFYVGRRAQAVAPCCIALAISPLASGSVNRRFRWSRQFFGNRKHRETDRAGRMRRKHSDYGHRPMS